MDKMNELTLDDTLELITILDWNQTSPASFNKMHYSKGFQEG